MSAYQLYEILKSVDGVTEEQAREAVDGIIYTDGVVTKEDLKDKESRVATKKVTEDIESQILTTKYLDARLSEFENKMLRGRRIQSGIIITAVSLIIVISELVI